mmetsp:Transcript_55216/g.176953  ORF Transcript_55216/g.176953 Transcript_55216/m.176953 type:complete len:279 (-) Transcript_55216:719-1555(-)
MSWLQRECPCACCRPRSSRYLARADLRCPCTCTTPSFLEPTRDGMPRSGPRARAPSVAAAAMASGAPAPRARARTGPARARAAGQPHRSSSAGPAQAGRSKAAGSWAAGSARRRVAAVASLHAVVAARTAGSSWRPGALKAGGLAGAPAAARKTGSAGATARSGRSGWTRTAPATHAAGSRLAASKLRSSGRPRASGCPAAEAACGAGPSPGTAAAQWRSPWASARRTPRPPASGPGRLWSSGSPLARSRQLATAACGSSAQRTAFAARSRLAEASAC